MPTAMVTISDPGTRERLTGAAVRGFLGIAEDWALSEAQQLTLLGASISRPTLQVWKAKGAKTPLNIDQLTRISLLLGIYEGLQRVFRQAPAENARWLRGPRLEAPFDGSAPLDMMLQRGISGIEATRRHVDSAVGGPPSRSWQPSEISLGSRHGAPGNTKQAVTSKSRGR